MKKSKPRTDGNSLRRLFKDTPLTDSTKALLLGTLLGDGSLEQGVSNRHLKYRASHGLPQKAYCWEKYLRLKQQLPIGLPPKDIPNGGYGTTTVRFETLVTPALEFLRPLCLVPHATKPRRWSKYVTQAWADQLTWEAVAWWFMDDGARQANHIQISTHSFLLEEVQRLADWLAKNGCPAYPRKTRKGPKKEYWILVIPTESAKIFREQVMPYMHPTMLYKLDFEERLGFKCMFCGNEFRQEGKKCLVNPEIPCCSNPACVLERNRTRNDRWQQRIGMKELYQRQLRRNEENPEKAKAQQEKARARQRERFADPAYRAKQQAWKREYRAKRKEEGKPDSAPRLQHTCQFCGTPFSNSKEHSLTRNAEWIYCSSPECVAKKDELRLAGRGARQSEKRRLRMLCRYCGEEFQNNSQHRLSPNAPILFCQKSECREKRDADYTVMRMQKAKDRREQKKAGNPPK